MIITLMINMFMKSGAPIPGLADIIDTYQQTSMQFCVIVAAVCAPTMLLAKPIILGCCCGHKKHEVHELEMPSM